MTGPLDRFQNVGGNYLVPIECSSGANGAAKRITTVYVIGVSTAIGLPSTG